MCTIDLFTHKIKPAILIQYGTLKPEQNKHFNKLKSLNYPHICLEGSTMFFQSEDQRDSFKERAIQIESIDGKEIQRVDNRLLGLELGYPPLAVKAFCEKFKDSPEDKAILHYYGLQFTCYYYDVKECIQWLKKNLPKIPLELKRESRLYFRKF